MRGLPRLTQQWLLVVLLVLLLAVGRVSSPSPVNAETLLERAYRTDLNALGLDQVLHSRVITYQRVDPNAAEPPDPYHQPFLAFLSSTAEIESWMRGGQVNQSRSTTRDVRSGRVLADVIRDGTRSIFFNADSGYASVRLDEPQPDSRPTPQLPFTEFARQKRLKITGSVPSKWGKPAWTVQALVVPPPAEVLSTWPRSQPPLLQKPYLSDLTVTGFEDIWIVDQESERIVQHEARILTPSGPVVLSRIENSPPEILPSSALRADWLAFPLESVPVSEARAPAPLLPTDAVSLPKAIAAADFAVFLPEMSRWGLNATYITFKPNPEPKEVWQRHWRFEVQDASAHGLALEVGYVPPTFDGRALAVVQGPSARLVPLMRETFPIWARSYSVQLALGNEPVTAWVATGGVLDYANRQTVVMFEVGDTFVFVVGQNLPEAEVLDVVRTFRRQP